MKKKVNHKGLQLAD